MILMTMFCQSIINLFLLYIFIEAPKFAKDTDNVTVPIGRDAMLSCAINNLGNFKVRFLPLFFSLLPSCYVTSNE